MRRGALLLVVSLLGCGEPPEEPPARCLHLQQQGEGPLTAPPARLSLFFSVDTCQGVPVPGLTEENFRIKENGQPVSVYESRLTIHARAEKFRMYSLLLLDLSGSVMASGSFGKLKDAAEGFAQRVLAQDPSTQRVAIYTFDGGRAPVALVPFTSDLEAVRVGLSSLETVECRSNTDCADRPERRTCSAWRCVDDSTNLHGAIAGGVSRLEAALQEDTQIAYRKGALVVFTDGSDQAARVPAQEARQAVERTPAQVYTVGLGGEVDPQSLTVFGKNGYFSASRPEELGAAFEQVASHLTAVAQRFYVVEYCSPKRDGEHELEIEATWPGVEGPPLVGSVKARFDASHFESGCEL